MVNNKIKKIRPIKCPVCNSYMTYHGYVDEYRCDGKPNEKNDKYVSSCGWYNLLEVLFLGSKSIRSHYGKS